MELTQDKINLIERVVKANRKFPGNEDLYEDFFNETCKRSLAVLNNVESQYALETYLRKIATTSIITVLKNSGRLRRTKGKYMATNEVVVESFETPAASVSTGVFYVDVDVKNVPEDLVIRKEILEKIVTAVNKLALDAPQKQYLELFSMRYTKNMSQKQIAGELGLSQSEVSKRLMRLMEGVKQAFGQ